MKQPYFLSVVHQSLGLFFVVLLLFTADRLVLLGSMTGPQAFAETFNSLWQGLRYDLRWSSLLSLSLVLPHVLCYFLSPQQRTFFTNLYVHTIICIVIVLLTVDFFYFRYTGARINPTVFALMRPLSVAIKMVWQTYPVFGILLVLAGIHFICYKIYRLLLRVWKRFSFSMVNIGLMGVLWLMMIWGSLRKYPLTWSDAWAHSKNGVFTINPAEAFFYGWYFHEDDPLPWEKPDLQVLSVQWKRDSAHGLRMNRMKQMLQQRLGNDFNVVLILAESLSTHKTSMSGNTLQATPALQGMLKDALYFPYCFTPHYGTARAVWSIFTGIPDVSLKYLSIHRIPAPGIRSALNEIPFVQRFYFMGGDGTWADIKGFMHHAVDKLQFVEETGWRQSASSVWGLDDDDLFAEADSLLRLQSQPFFAVIQTAGNHRPYQIPAAAYAKGFRNVSLAKKTLEENGFASEAEYNALRYLDFCIGRYMQRASAAPYFRKTLFVIVGDHGNGGNASKLYPSRWNDFYLQMIHVPMLFYLPYSDVHMADSTYRSIMDILPSIAQLKNVPLKYGRNGVGIFSDTLRNGLFYMLHEAGQLGWHTRNTAWLRPIDELRSYRPSSANKSSVDFGQLTLHAYRLYRRQLKGLDSTE